MKTCIKRRILVLGASLLAHTLALGSTVPGDDIMLSPTGNPIAGLSITPYSAPNMQRWFFWDAAKDAFRVGIFTYDRINPDNMGDHSTAFGYNSYAKGDYSAAFGFSSYAAGDYSVATGYNGFVTADFAFAGGYWSWAGGEGSFAYGMEVSTTSSYSMGHGCYNYESSDGYASFMSGEGISLAGSPFSFVQGNYSIIEDSPGSVSFGYNTHYNVTHGFSVGNNNSLGNYGGNNYSFSSAIGAYNQVKASYATAIGYGLKVGSPHSLVLGKYNEDTGPYGPLFAIGYGTSDTDRRDIFSIYEEGNEAAVYAGSYYGDGSGLTGLVGGQVHAYNNNVGIGTPTPGYKTEIVGGGTNGAHTKLLQIRSKATGTNTATTLRFANDISPTASQGAAEISTIRTNSGTTGATDMAFRVSSGASVVERMRIKSNGRVGIGTDQPLSKLHIQHQQSGEAQLQIGETPAASWKFWGGNDLRIRKSNNEDAMIFWQNGRVDIYGELYAKVPERGGISMGQFTSN